MGSSDSKPVKPTESSAVTPFAPLYGSGGRRRSNRRGRGRTMRGGGEFPKQPNGGPPFRPFGSGGRRRSNRRGRGNRRGRVEP